MNPAGQGDPAVPSGDTLAYAESYIALGWRVFPVHSVRDAWNQLNPDELVLAVGSGKNGRAYPINMLTGPQREILNDTLGGTALAATW